MRSSAFVFILFFSFSLIHPVSHALASSQSNTRSHEICEHSSSYPYEANEENRKIRAKIPHLCCAVLCCVRILVRFALYKSIRCDNNNDISNTFAETNIPIKFGHKHSFSIRIATLCDSRIFDMVKCFF